MFSTDSVSVFAEGTFEEQTQELVEYATRSLPEDERASSLQSFKDIVKDKGEEDISLEKKREVLEFVLANTTSIGEGTQQAIEGFFNLLFSHLLVLFPDSSPEASRHVSSLLNVISASPAENSSIKYRIMSNLFNATPRTSSLRLSIWSALLTLAATNNQLDIVPFSKEEVERWLKEWCISDEERSNFLEFIVDTLVRAGQLESAYQYRLFYMQSLPSSEQSRTAAIDTIAAALQLPSIFDFEALCKFEAVVAVKDHKLYSLLQIFLNDGLSEFRPWADSNSAVLDAHQLDRSQLERKLRLLSFSSVAFEYIGRDLPYSEIASTLQIDLSQVEKWTIDVIRAGLVRGKLCQPAQTLHVTYSSARKFGRVQWEALERRLLAWKTGLAGVIEVVAAARGAESTGEGAQTLTVLAEQGIQVESAT